MPNPRLSEEQRREADQPLARIRQWIDDRSGDNPDLRFAYLRRIWKQLEYDERGKPANRKRLKKMKHQEQGGRCGRCGEALPSRGSELDRHEAKDGYTRQNTRWLCPKWHRGF